MKPLDPSRKHPRLETIPLQSRAVLAVEPGLGQRVTCLEGTVWITQAFDARDIVLTDGQCFTLDRPGKAVLFALSNALITIGAAADAPANDDCHYNADGDRRAA